MAYGKRTYKKRSTMRKSRRRFNISRKTYIRKNTRVNHLTCKRYTEAYVGINGNDFVNSGTGSATFQLNALTNYAEFTALFDQYQIMGVQYRWRVQRDPSVNSSTASATQGIYPRLFWVHDHDDSSTPANQNVLFQYPRMREISFTDNKDTTKWYYLKPAVATQIYGPVNVGYSAKWRAWLDSNYPGTPHYGIKYAYNSLNSGMQLYMDCKFVLKFKTVI